MGRACASRGRASGASNDWRDVGPFGCGAGEHHPRCAGPRWRAPSRVAKGRTPTHGVLAATVAQTWFDGAVAVARHATSASVIRCLRELDAALVHARTAAPDVQCGEVAERRGLPNDVGALPKLVDFEGAAKTAGGLCWETPGWSCLNGLSMSSGREIGDIWSRDEHRARTRGPHSGHAPGTVWTCILDTSPGRTGDTRRILEAHTWSAHLGLRAGHALGAAQ